MYAVDKCCSFKQLITQLEYSAEEVDSILESFKKGGMNDANLEAMAEKLRTKIHLQLDQMHLIGRMRHAMPRMDAYQKGFFHKYCALFWEILDPSSRGKDWRKVPQSKRRILNPTDLVERFDSFANIWSQDANVEMKKQLGHARTHAVKGCISDLAGVP